MTTTTTTSPVPRTPPPLVLAAQRLERLLVAESSLSEAQYLSHSSPSKLVKRWLGTSSGVASIQKTSLSQVAQASKMLLHPQGPCATGRDLLLKFLVSSSEVESSVGDSMTMMVDMESTTVSNNTEYYYVKASEREIEAWLITLAIRILIFKSLSNRNMTTLDPFLQDAIHLSECGVKLLSTHLNENENLNDLDRTNPAKQRFSSLYPLFARMIRYRQWAYETSTTTITTTTTTRMMGLLSDSRVELANIYRISVLRRDVDTQAAVMNCMLRNLLQVDQVEQAYKLLTNSTFPTHASNNQLCRHLYYSGRIHAIRLDYTTAYSNLSTCLRKVPTHSNSSSNNNNNDNSTTNTAVVAAKAEASTKATFLLGFRIAVQRLLIVVQLLMGEIPERHVFYTAGMKGELEPYLKITQAVRRGDLVVFQDTVSLFIDRLRVDGTLTLISRLAHSVVKAGLRRLHVSYSRISLEDIAHRLGLKNVTSAEFVVAKAVKDGVIDATIVKSENGGIGGYVESHELVDVYATAEPAEAYHRRIAYCLTSYNDAIKGMRFRPDDYKKQLEASRGLRGKKDEDKTDEEKAKEFEEEMDGDY